MFTVKENKNNIIEIKKSNFISFSFRLEEFTDINKCLNTIKDAYKDASHCCFAYKFNNLKKSSGDKEPSGCAGEVILDVIDKLNLDNVLIVVVRYFGGIKLGAGGLIRAYSSASKSVVYDNICQLENGYLIEISTSYDNQNIIDYYIDINSIVDKAYTDKIYLKIKCNKKIIDLLNGNNIDYKIIKNILVEKE